MQPMRPCVRCGGSILSARACMPCVAEIRAKFGKQRTTGGAFVTWGFEKHSDRGGRCVVYFGDSSTDWRIPKTMRPATYFHRRLAAEIVARGLSQQSTDEDLAPVRRLFAEWAYRMECADGKRETDVWLYELAGDRPE